MGCDTPFTDYSVFHATRGLPWMVEVSANTNPQTIGGVAGTRYTTTVHSYVLVYASVGTDGRSAVRISQHFQQTFLWDETTQSANTSHTLGAVYAPLPVGSSHYTGRVININLPSTVTEVESDFDTNGNLTKIIDDGLIGTDPAIETDMAWNLPPGDTTGRNFRMTQKLTGYYNGSTLTTTTPGVREYDYVYDSVGRLIQTFGQINGNVALKSPPSSVLASRPLASPCGNSGCSGQDLLEVRGYDPTWQTLVSVGNQQNNGLVTINYDADAFRQFPTSTVVNSPQGPLGTHYSYDRGLERQSSVTAPDLETTQSMYDDFGRIVEIDAPDPASPLLTQPQVTVSYDDVGPIRHVHFEGADGYALGANGPVPGTFVKHDRYIDGFGDVRAAIDQIAATAPEGTPTLVSGVHANDQLGRLTTLYNPVGWSGTLPAQGSGQLPANVGAFGTAFATVSYDPLGRPNAGSDPKSNVWSKKYHTALLSVDTFDAEQQAAGSHTNSYTTVTMDGHGRTKSINRHAAASGGGDIVTSYDSYQATGEPTSITNGGVTRTMAYDSLGRMVANNEPNSGAWHYAYDFAGRLVGTSDARGCGQNIYYDTIGRLLAKDYVPCEPNTNGQSTYSPPTLDSSGALTGDGTEAFYVYNASGKLAEVKDVAKHDSYFYDPRGRLRLIQRSVATPNWVNYAAPANMPLLDYVPKLNSRYATNVFTKTIGYDFQDRLISATTGATAPQITAMGTTETRSYSLDGRLQTLQLTGGTTPQKLLVSNSVIYNAAQVYTTLNYGDAAGTSATSIYDANGLISSYHLARNGSPPWATVSPSGSDSDVTNLYQQSDLLNLTFTRDRVGNPTAITDTSTSTWPSGAKAVSQTFTYGNDYRLTGATSNNGNDKFVSPLASTHDHNFFPTFRTANIANRFKVENFSYDVRGNFTSSTDDTPGDFWDRSLGTALYSSAGPDQISSDGETAASPGSWDASQQTTDAAGNVNNIYITSGSGQYAGVSWYRYDEIGRLTIAGYSSWDWGQPEYFMYGDDGERIIRVHQVENGQFYLGGPASATVYVFDSLELHNAAFTNGAYQDDATTEQVHVGGGLGRIFYDSDPSLPQVNGNRTHLFMTLSDGRGSGGVVIDHDSGEVVERMAYQPYGNSDADYRPARWNNNYERQKFGGHWDNAEAGLVYMGARYYSPQLGRFMTPDPLWVHGLAGDPNPYEYAGGNPIRFTDHNGLSKADVGLFFAGLGVMALLVTAALLQQPVDVGAGGGVGGAVGEGAANVGLQSAASAADIALGQADAPPPPLLQAPSYTQSLIDASNVYANKPDFERDTAQLRNEAIRAAIEQYHIDTSNVLSGPSYSALIPELGRTSRRGDILIGPDAFTTAGWLGSTIAHETIHALQAAQGRFYTKPGNPYDPPNIVNPVGYYLNEAEAYHFEIANSQRFGLGADELSSAKRSYKDIVSEVVRLGGARYAPRLKSFNFLLIR